MKNYRIGLTETEIRINEDGLYAVFLKSRPWEHCKNSAISPCKTQEEMQIKLDKFAAIKKYREVRL